MINRMRRLEKYVAGGHRRVNGWLEQRSAEVIAELATFQTSQGLSGAVGEIGVHHGRLFILLALAAQEGEKVFAIDVFEDQHLNVDKSGKGDRELFYYNVRRHGLAPERLDVITGSSLEMSGDQLLDRVGPVRMISIDGGHTVECVINDLAIADIVSTEHGIVIIDDVFNSSWPSVVSGYAEYLQATPRTIPFASSPNKVFACPEPFVDLYRSHLRKAFAHLYDKSDEFFGFPIDSYGAWKRPSLPVRAARRAKYEVQRRLVSTR